MYRDRSMRRRKGQGDVVIDLTSLLDVVFIVLLVLLCGQRAETDKAKDLMDKAMEEMQEAEDTKDLYNNMKNASDNINEHVSKIAISVPYDKAEITKRNIRILSDDKGENRFELVGVDVDKSFEGFKDYLSAYIQSNSGEPVIIFLNEDQEKILYRDERKVNEIIGDLQKKYDNVYLGYEIE